MNTPRRYIAKAVIRPVREDNTYDIEAVQDPNGDWVAYEDYKVIENALRHHIEQEALRKVGEALHQRNIDSGVYNREKNEVIARLQAEVAELTKDACEADKEYKTLKVEANGRQAENSILALENDRLTTEIERLKRVYRAANDEAEGYLKKIQRLIEAGNALAALVEPFKQPTKTETAIYSLKNWQSAKVGEPDKTPPRKFDPSDDNKIKGLDF